MTELRSVTVYCGSSPGHDPVHTEAAWALGTTLAERGIALVYGGGRVGLMGVVADAVLTAGGEVTGVITQHLWDREVGHVGLTELVVVHSMHERKLAMADRSEAFVALPGGVGTLEELFEVLTWTQLGLHHKPVGVLDVAGYYQPLLHFLDTAAEAGFVRPAHRALLHAHTTAEGILDLLAAWEPEYVPKWTEADQR